MIITRKGTFNTIISVEETFRAPKDKVFKAWTTPESLKKWFMADEGVVVTNAELNLNVSGKYRIEVLFPGNEPSNISGEFIKVHLNESLDYTWTVPVLNGRITRVEVEFMNLDKGSKIKLSHGEFKNEEELQLHLDGWKGCLGRLHQFLAE